MRHAGHAQEVRSIAVYSRRDAEPGQASATRGTPPLRRGHRRGGAMTTGSLEGMTHGARSSYLSAASVHRSPAPAAAPAARDAHVELQGSPALRRGFRSAFVLLAFIGIAAIVAAFGSLVSASAIDGWYAGTAKPMWNPPNAVFGPVWAVLYVTMSVAAWLVWRSANSDARSRAPPHLRCSTRPQRPLDPRLLRSRRSHGCSGGVDRSRRHRHSRLRHPCHDHPIR